MLAIIPSVSVLAVTARSAAFGFTHGVLTALGIVVADILFILVAVYGLALVAELMGRAIQVRLNTSGVLPDLAGNIIMARRR